MERPAIRHGARWKEKMRQRVAFLIESPRQAIFWVAWRGLAYTLQIKSVAPDWQDAGKNAGERNGVGGRDARSKTSGFQGVAAAELINVINA
jgi:hypothetical protein